jgi:CheY-like chemotaxis protein
MKYKLVLLIDDDADSNFVNSWVLKKDFAEVVDSKQSASEALEYLKNRSNLQLPLPEIIFLDIRMPLMDGFAFLEEFDQLHSETKNNVRIVMLSSSYDKSDYNKALSNPYVEKYINKPLTEDAITKL